jgi:hypothetical protein
MDVTGLNSHFKPQRFNSQTACCLEFCEVHLTAKDVSNINFQDWKEGLATMAWVP